MKWPAVHHYTSAAVSTSHTFPLIIYSILIYSVVLVHTSDMAVKFIRYVGYLLWFSYL